MHLWHIYVIGESVIETYGGMILVLLCCNCNIKASYKSHQAASHHYMLSSLVRYPTLNNVLRLNIEMLCPGRRRLYYCV